MSAFPNVLAPKAREASLTCALLVLALCVFAVPSVHAAGENGNGSPSPVSRAMNTDDPFAESHARLMRAADAQLQNVRDNPEKAARETQDASGSSRGTPWRARLEESEFSAASPEAVAGARDRLRALGVDADRIFAEEGVPQALLVVAQVESNFNPLALSPKGARGLWQLMPETAARFGLRVDARIDERTHPERATRAAARYLRELYLRFGDWLLALAAYNAGEGRVESALARVPKLRDQPAPSSRASFWQLATLGLLPEETRRYVPAILARL